MEQEAVLGKRGRSTPSFHPHKRRAPAETKHDHNALAPFVAPDANGLGPDLNGASLESASHEAFACCLDGAVPPMPCTGQCPEGPALVSCSDRACSDPPCPDLGLCHSIDCLTPCFDSSCHVEPCPDGDACDSPCYSPDCHVPSCDDGCPSNPVPNIHCADEGQFCLPQSSWDMSCRCVDPACLQLRGFPHCHEPTHCHHDLVNLMAPPALPIGRERPMTDNYSWHDFFPANSSYHDPVFDTYPLEAPATPALTNSSTSTPLTSGSAGYKPIVAVETEPVCLWVSNHDDPDHICGKKFESPDELHQHVVEAHIKGLKREDKTTNGFWCHWQGCDRFLCRSFTARPKLCRHVQCHSQYKPFSCSVCQMEFKTKDSREKHERTHTGQRPYKCSEPGCQSAFSTSTELRTHQIVHSGAKPYSCPLCTATFADSSNLSKHKATHMLGKFVCPDCGIRMRRWDQLRRHLVTQNHAKLLLDDKRVQEEYKARMLKDFKELPDEQKLIVKGGADSEDGY